MYVIAFSFALGSVTEGHFTLQSSLSGGHVALGPSFLVLPHARGGSQSWPPVHLAPRIPRDFALAYCGLRLQDSPQNMQYFNLVWAPKTGSIS